MTTRDKIVLVIISFLLGLIIFGFLFPVKPHTYLISYDYKFPNDTNEPSGVGYCTIQLLKFGTNELAQIKTLISTSIASNKTASVVFLNIVKLDN